MAAVARCHFRWRAGSPEAKSAQRPGSPAIAQAGIPKVARVVLSSSTMKRMVALLDKSPLPSKTALRARAGLHRRSLRVEQSHLSPAIASSCVGLLTMPAIDWVLAPIRGLAPMIQSGTKVAGGIFMGIHLQTRFRMWTRVVGEVLSKVVF